MSKHTDTPETDHIEKSLGIPTHPALLMVCRKLERERDWALKRVVVLEKQISGLNRFTNERCEEILRVRKERDEARCVAENLVEYAHECLVKLESWGKGYERYELEMDKIREAIAGCEKWMEAAK